ncbi:hypothetical protein TIFTF001_017814 [Ficus carica]|uniref:Uncharacterized protein n=1 Tax=Ficus carica TaxID=3494 RepID=A0AA88ABD7_FICCA|nr:hypothetical protein TIFTF001_017814 [Ficus carica]
MWIINYAVMVTAPGYRAKTTHIWLEEAATTVDFVLDPEVTPNGNLLRSACECNCGSLSRRIKHNLSKQRQYGLKRPVAV